MRGLRAIRAERLLTIDGLAALSGVSDRTISNIEGRRARPQPSTIERLCLALDVEPGEVAEFRSAIDGVAGD